MTNRAHGLSIAVAALLAGCGLFGSAGPRNIAATEQTSADEKMVFADQNRDGRVTRREAKVDGALVAAFDRYDRNDDDALDRAEFARLEAEADAKASDTDLREFARPRNDPVRWYQ